MSETKKGSIFAAALFGVVGLMIGVFAFDFGLLGSTVCTAVAASIGLGLNILFDRIDEQSAGAAANERPKD